MLIVAVAVALLKLTFVFGAKAGVPLEKGPAAVCLGIYVIYLSVLPLLSYFYSRSSFILGGIMWICEQHSSPRGRRMALFYFALALALGLSALLVGLGALGK